MRFDVITLFPDLFAPFLTQGVTRRAFEKNIVDLRFTNPRDFTITTYQRVDDRPFGGGAGMVMQAEPLAQSVEHIWMERAQTHRSPVIYFSPTGETLTQSLISTWATSSGAILLCGRYEGVDQRFIDQYVDHEISLGDFVLSGGEIAALAFLDAIARLQPQVLNDANSHVFDSFSPAIDGLLDCPQYTRPTVWREREVPVVLLSGHHAEMDAWRRNERLKKTWEGRPELIEKARQQGRLTDQDETFLKRLLRQV